MFAFLFFIFFLLHLTSLTHTAAKRVGLRLSLFSNEKREFFMIRGERESKEERVTEESEKKLFFIQLGDYFNR